jgi:adenine C2-methylase RlmN of 23S rRNA A2503 and tRNA A37
MKPIARREQLMLLFPDAPAFRLRQFEEALFDPALQTLADISPLPLAMREKLATTIPLLSLSPVQVFESVKKDTYKAVVELADKTRVETVLMHNARGQWTVCVSSQVGCAMGCKFCATGSMGLSRNLLADEIIDQYRFWQQFLFRRPELKSGRISNIVFMGMGEPLANYENVKETINQLLQYTDLGPTHITVSTVGLLPMMRKILSDTTWPAVRLAVSVHSAVSATRKAMMPSSYDTFLEDLILWTKEYFAKNETRRRHLTFEYVMLSRVNDSEVHAKALIDFARRVGKVRINLIPYNYTGSVYRDSLPADFASFEEQLKDAEVTVTRRRTMGDDIAAACGQLIVEKNKA